MTLEAANARKGGKKVWAHMNKYHPELRQPKGTKICKRKGLPSWKCDICHLWLSADKPRRLEHQRRAHIATMHPGVDPAVFSTINGKRRKRDLRALVAEKSTSSASCASKKSRKVDLDRIRHELLEDGDIESNPGP